MTVTWIRTVTEGKIFSVTTVEQKVSLQDWINPPVINQLIRIWEHKRENTSEKDPLENCDGDAEIWRF